MSSRFERLEARTVFEGTIVDVREGDLNIDPALISAAVTERTKAIMPVHLAGQPADMDPIWELGIPVIEDAAHAAAQRAAGV